MTDNLYGIKRAVFFDRDGIVNRRRVDDYVRNWDGFEFLPDIFNTLRQVHDAGRLAVIVSNQRGIARGLMTEDDLAEIHRLMQRELRRRCGHAFDAIYHCPHGIGDGCDCRKPQPGMLRRAARELGIDLAASWIVGDSESDIQAGHAAGCRAAKVDADMGASLAEIVVPSLSEAWEHIFNTP